MRLMEDQCSSSPDLGTFVSRVIKNPYLQERAVDSVFLARHERDSVSTGSREYNNGSGAVAGRMHAKSFVGPQAHSHGPLCMQALQGSTPLVVTPPSRQTRNLARASRETPSPPIALEVGIELLDTRASLPRLPRPLSLCKKKSLRTREREGGRAHHRICPLKSTFGWLGHQTVH